MTPQLYVGLAIAATWAASIGGAFFYGQGVGSDREKAHRADLETVQRVTQEAAQKGAAIEIAGIKMTNKTIFNEVQREVRTNTVYRDCVLPADGLRLANEALAGRSIPSGAGVLPEVGAPSR